MQPDITERILSDLKEGQYKPSELFHRLFKLVENGDLAKAAGVSIDTPQRDALCQRILMLEDTLSRLEKK